MSHEFAVFIALYIIVLGGHIAHNKYTQWRIRREQARLDAEALAPLSSLSAAPRPPSLFVAFLRRHLHAAGVAILMHPATLETCKHYVVHFFIYSGIIIPH